MADEVRELIEDGVMGVIAGFAVEGTLLRGLWVFVARYSMRARRWLLLRDTWETMQRDSIPGEFIFEWAEGRSTVSMAEQIVEHIRKAPRAYGVSTYLLEVGQRGVEGPAMTSGTWGNDTLAVVTAFLSMHDPQQNRVARLLLIGQTLAAVKQCYNWSS